MNMRVNSVINFYMLIHTSSIHRSTSLFCCFFYRRCWRSIAWGKKEEGKSARVVVAVYVGKSKSGESTTSSFQLAAWRLPSNTNRCSLLSRSPHYHYALSVHAHILHNRTLTTTTTLSAVKVIRKAPKISYLYSL